MPLPQRTRLGHEIPHWVAGGGFFFITINCIRRNENQLCRADVGNAVLSACAHNHQKCAWYCRLMVLMPDHLHAIICFPRDPGMKTTISRWKHFLATHNKIEWQRDFFDHRLRDECEENEKASYVLSNPLRKGLCERVEEWPWVWRPGAMHQRFVM